MEILSTMWPVFTCMSAVLVMALAEELKMGTIEKIMEKSDMEIGIESLKKYF
jgi:hypothetical protein